MNKRILIAAALLAASLVPASAQKEGEDQAPSRFQLWKASFPNGEYAVALWSITSVSTHEYVVDGVAKVFELTIDTRGAALTRIYYIEALTATPGGIAEGAVGVVRDKVNEVRERLDTAGVTNAVVKNYPATTHAKTIEYRVSSREQVEKLYKSVMNAWTRGVGATEKVKE